MKKIIYETIQEMRGTADFIVHFTKKTKREKNKTLLKPGIRIVVLKTRAFSTTATKVAIIIKIHRWFSKYDTKTAMNLRLEKKM